MHVTNHVSAELPVADQQAVIAAIATIRAKLPFLVDLTDDESAGLAKFGPKSHAFVGKVLHTTQLNTQILPPSFSLAEFERDYALWQTLQPIQVQLTQLQELFNDTMAALGSDLYTEALTSYSYLKVAGSGAGLDELKSLVGQRFARRPVASKAVAVPA